MASERKYPSIAAWLRRVYLQAHELADKLDPARTAFTRRCRLSERKRELVRALDGIAKKACTGHQQAMNGETMLEGLGYRAERNTPKPLDPTNRRPQ